MYFYFAESSSGAGAKLTRTLEGLEKPHEKRMKRKAGSQLIAKENLGYQEDSLLQKYLSQEEVYACQALY